VGYRVAQGFPEVAAFVRAAIVRSVDLATFRDLLTHLMAQPGRVLARQGPARWPAFVLDTCRALGGDPGVATGAAAALEFAVAAADVVDDLADDEWGEAVASRPRALNASLALGFLAQRCASELAGPLGAARACRIATLLSQGCLAAGAGQDLDLVLETTPEVSEELAYEMTRCKSGSIVAMACQLGAAVAVDDPAVIEAAGRFGCHVGMVAQLLNDLLGVDPANPARGSDLRRGKKTLPVAYALRCVREEGLAPVLGGFGGTGVPDKPTEARWAGELRELGALDYAWVVADAHRREALAALRALARLTGRDEVRGLRRLIPGMRAPRSRRRAP
jgi:geranylgeranyl pyrophosphate synthase